MDIAKKRERFLYQILIISALLILNFSLETMMMAKDPDIYSTIAKVKQELTYGDYLNALIFNLFIKVINPIVISLYTFFTIKKYGINMFYKIFFGGMTLIGIINHLLQFSFGSVFYYVGLILDIALLIVITRQER